MARVDMSSRCWSFAATGGWLLFALGASVFRTNPSTKAFIAPGQLSPRRVVPVQSLGLGAAATALQPPTPARSSVAGCPAGLLVLGPVVLLWACGKRSQSRKSAAPRGRVGVQQRAFADPALLDQLLTHVPTIAELQTTAAPVSAAVGQLPPVEELQKALDGLMRLLGPPEAANAFEANAAAQDTWAAVSNFFFDPRLQWDENGNVLLDPKGDPLPDNVWTQFVAVQATLMKRLDQGISGLGIPQSFGLAVVCYTLLVRALLYPAVKGQLEVAAKIQVLAPRVNELKEKHKDNEELMQQEVGMLYMDLQVDPLAAVIPLLLQLPIFWGLYRGIRRLGIVEYEHLNESFLWIPSLYGPNYTPDPSFKWITEWQGPLITLHPKIGWEDFALYSILPLGVFFAYKQVLSESVEQQSTKDNSSKILQLFPFLLAFICVELPQAMGIYIATNIASSVALTAYTKAQISAKIPGYDEFVKTGKWPPGVDPERVLAEAFGVKRLSEDDSVYGDPVTVPEAVFAGRADFIPALLEQGRKIDDYDDRGITASAYTLALDNTDLLLRLFELGADPMVRDKNGNSLLHYCTGYGRSAFLPVLLENGLDKILNDKNKDGQTALDVARVNLSQEKVADDVRKVIPLLVEAGAEGATTTEADEARFEEERERKKREKEVTAARQALMALAKGAAAAKKQAEEAAASAKTDAAAESESHAAPQEEAQEPGSILAESLDRVKSFDIETLKERLGDKLSEEQLEKLSARLAKLSPEDLARYMAGLPTAKEVMKEEAADSPAPAAPANGTQPKEGAAPPSPAPAEERRQSVLVD